MEKSHKKSGMMKNMMGRIDIALVNHFKKHKKIQNVIQLKNLRQPANDDRCYHRGGYLMRIVMGTLGIVFLLGICAWGAEFSYYNDNFEKLRPDVWETSLYVYKNMHEKDFAAADVLCENGKLVMHTKTGKFSKGTIRSLFNLVGDFDVQIDMKMDFDRISRTPQHAMFWLHEVKNNDDAVVLIFKPGNESKVRLLLLRNRNSNDTVVAKKRFSSFDGTFRWVRKGSELTCFFREEGESDWSRIGSTQYSEGPVQLGVNLRNFHRHKSAKTNTDSPVTLEVDNFRINSVQTIKESDI